MAQGKGQKVKKAAVRVLALLLALTAFLWWSHNSLQVEQFTLQSSHLPSPFHGLRIVQLSDLHGRQFGKDNRRLIKAVQEQKPDMIAVTGDLLDEEHREVDSILPLMKALVETAPTYYITGNHEWAAHIVPELTEKLESVGVRCLRNEFEPIEKLGCRIVVAGVDDPNGPADQKTPQQLAAELKRRYEGNFWLLLAHRNVDYYEYAGLGADLILTGHAHGGVIRLPGTDGLVGPRLEWFPTWTDGIYLDFATPMFVSRGLGGFRLFNRPQVAVLELKCA